MPASGPSIAPDGGAYVTARSARRPRRRAASAAAVAGKNRFSTWCIAHPPTGWHRRSRFPADPGAAADRLERDLGVVVAHGQTLAHLVREATRARRTRPPPRCAHVGRGGTGAARPRRRARARPRARGVVSSHCPHCDHVVMSATRAHTTSIGAAATAVAATWYRLTSTSDAMPAIITTNPSTRNARVRPTGACASSRLRRGLGRRSHRAAGPTAFDGAGGDAVGVAVAAHERVEVAEEQRRAHRGDQLAEDLVVEAAEDDVHGVIVRRDSARAALRPAQKPGLHTMRKSTTIIERSRIGPTTPELLADRRHLGRLRRRAADRRRARPPSRA